MRQVRISGTVWDGRVNELLVQSTNKIYHDYHTQQLSRCPRGGFQLGTAQCRFPGVNMCVCSRALLKNVCLGKTTLD